MDQKILAELKDKLEKDKLALEKELQVFAEKNRQRKGDWDAKFPSFDTNHSLEEEADEVEEYGNLLPMEKTLETKLQEVVLALKRLAENSYGRCEKCHQEIETERLLAIPETRVCNQCKK